MISVFQNLMAKSQKGLSGLLADSINAYKGKCIFSDADIMVEIPAAFGIDLNVMAVVGATQTAMPNGPEMIDGALELGIESRMCSGIKSGIYMIESGMVKKPDMIITTNACCDAMTTLSNIMNNYKPWADVPKFMMDSPHSNDEESYAYFGRQLRQAVTFIEDVLGQKMDWDRFHNVCLESNKQTQLIMEFQELKKAVPIPAHPDLARQGTEISRWISQRVTPEVTQWLEELVKATEQNVKEGIGIEGVQQKVRMLWWDLAGTWPPVVLMERLQKELGAVAVIDYVSYGTWTLVDLSNEEALFTSLAKRFLLESPMTRQCLHNTELFLNDITGIVKDFKCDCVIVPAHIGHRDTNSRLKVVRDVCREKGIPCLVLGMDIWDKRYMTPETAFDRIKTFFETTGLI
jgi:benzoyl-CoA reductase/2-hydroxyglutaryl-CoA dehydratase subunit BcrC/BadD/HgdB